MKIAKNKCFRGMLLSIAYLLGAMGIVATGGDGDNSERRRFCGLVIQSIAPATDIIGDIWVGAVSKTAEGDHHSVNRLRIDGIEKASYSLGYADGEELVQTLAIAVDALNADKVYVGGDFSGGILRLNADASVDGSFVVGSGFDDRVTSIVPAADGSGDIYVGGFFSSYNGTLVSGLVRLNSDGSLDSVGFTAAPVSSIESVALAVDALFLGDIYSAGGTGVDRWGNSGIRDGSFNPPIASAFTVTPAADGSNAIFVSGSAAIGIVRVNGDGSINGGFDIGSGFDSDVLSVIRADDMTGDIYAGGRFTTYDGGSANGIVRLNGVDGSRNVNFLIGNGFTNAPDDPSPLSTVSSLARATDGSTDVYVGGGFAFYNGTQSNGIVRLNDDGSLDTRFAVEIDVDGGLCTNETILGLD